MIPIDKDIPPPPDSRGGRRAKYPFAEMEVGQSFLIPGGTSAGVSGTIGGAARRLGWRFTARTVEGGVRIWRIA